MNIWRPDPESNRDSLICNDGLSVCIVMIYIASLKIGRLLGRSSSTKEM
jgi:hypothetical protein